MSALLSFVRFKKVTSVVLVVIATCLTACGGGGGGGGDTPPANGSGGSVTGPSFTTQPSNQTVIAGQKATFSVSTNGATPISYQWKRNSENISGATNQNYETPITTTADNGAQYTVVVSNSVGSISSNVAILNVSSSNTVTGAPQITSQTRIAFSPEGIAVTFQVAAAGTPPLSYQWKKNGQIIPNANSSEYLFSNPSLSDSGSQFQVTVSNGIGAVSSAPITLTVAGTPVQISVQPSPQTISAGGTATFSTAATGSAPITYQWYQNGVAIPGATGASYQFHNAMLINSGDLFSAVATNPTGYAGSQVVALTVSPSAPQQSILIIDSSTTKAFVSRGTNDLYSISYSRESRQILDTQGVTGINLSSYAYPGYAPISYDASITLAGFNDGSFYSDMSLNEVGLAIASPIGATINGKTVKKYDLTKSLVYPSPLLNVSVFNAFDSGFREVEIGQWKYVSSYQSGYFAGWPTARGTFIAGTPTSSAGLSSISSASYSGIMYAGTEAVGRGLLDLSSISGAANVSYNASTKVVSITLSNIQSYFGEMVLSGVVTTTSDWPLGSPLNWQPISCTAQISLPTNSFSCDITGTLLGKIDGKFFGTVGSEIGATFRLTPAGTDDGIVGSFMVKAP